MFTEDKITNVLVIIFAVIMFSIIIGFMIMFADMYIRNRNEEDYCRKLPYEEYKIDTRCHEILED